jgi:hypothetical protein
MVVYGFGEKDIQVVGVILAAKGYFTLNMRDIADMGVKPPGDKKYHPDDWGSNDEKHKKKSEYWGSNDGMTGHLLKCIQDVIPKTD